MRLEAFRLSAWDAVGYRGGGKQMRQARLYATVRYESMVIDRRSSKKRTRSAIANTPTLRSRLLGLGQNIIKQHPIEELAGCVITSGSTL